MKKIIGYALVIIMIVAMSKIIVNAFEDKYIDESQYTYHSYYIQSGDTLWDLAEEYALETDDLRAWINTVERINGCSANIRSGNYLIICVPKGVDN